MLGRGGSFWGKTEGKGYVDLYVHLVIMGVVLLQCWTARTSCRFIRILHTISSGASLKRGGIVLVEDKIMWSSCSSVTGKIGAAAVLERENLRRFCSYFTDDIQWRNCQYFARYPARQAQKGG